MAVVIDTSVFIDLQRRTHLRDVHLETVFGEQVALASITAPEPLTGAFYAIDARATANARALHRPDGRSLHRSALRPRRSSCPRPVER